ncbi:MAG: hypothetical protein IID45_12865, partial [Planctomycetes bacterium]|nr:hypothetical protein [Planctomycetota bacterium]
MMIVPLSDPATYRASDLAAIPPDASSFSILSMPVADLIRRGRDAYVASQRPKKRERLGRWWAALENELGIAFEAQVLANLGRSLIVHTYPRHPLGVPLLCTILVEIREDADAVR